MHLYVSYVPKVMGVLKMRHVCITVGAIREQYCSIFAKVVMISINI